MSPRLPSINRGAANTPTQWRALLAPSKRLNGADAPKEHTNPWLAQRPTAIPSTAPQILRSLHFQLAPPPHPAQEPSEADSPAGASRPTGAPGHRAGAAAQRLTPPHRRQMIRLDFTLTFIHPYNQPAPPPSTIIITTQRSPPPRTHTHAAQHAHPRWAVLLAATRDLVPRSQSPPRVVARASSARQKNGRRQCQTMVLHDDCGVPHCRSRHRRRRRRRRRSTNGKNRPRGERCKSASKQPATF